MVEDMLGEMSLYFGYVICNVECRKLWVIVNKVNLVLNFEVFYLFV